MSNRDKNVIFLSHMLNQDIPLYAGEKSVVIRKSKSIKKGDSCNSMYWSFPNHSGTHIDLPRHFINNGMSISGIKPRDLIFKSVGFIKLDNIRSGYRIKQQDMKDVTDCRLLLIKTDFERYRKKPVYWENSPFLDITVVKWLNKNCPSLKAIGVDFISVSNLKNRALGRKVHKALLCRNILLIEDMRLAELRGAPTVVIVAPLLVKGADASPCTVLAEAG